jgi:hypothetical protein
MADGKLTPPGVGPGPQPQIIGKKELEITIHGETESVYAYDSLDPTYVAKAKILNDALGEIGMGKYQVGPGLLWASVCIHYLFDLTPQWYLFVLTGFGWLS